MKQEKKKTILMIVAVLGLIAIIMGAAYAYFIAQGNDSAESKFTLTTGTTDSLLFTAGKPVTIAADQGNFYEGAGNRWGSTTATATLIAGTNNTARETYNVYLNIIRNDFEYTTTAKTPELILKVTGPDGVVESISGLNYNTTTKSFDITTKLGQIVIASEKEITTTSRLAENWTVTIEFVNLDSDQNNNTGCTFEAYLYIQKSEREYKPTLADVCADGDNLAGCINTYNNRYDYMTTKLIKHDGSYGNDAGDGSIRYSGGDQYGIDENVFGVAHIKYHEEVLHYSAEDLFASMYAKDFGSLMVKLELSGDYLNDLLPILNDNELYLWMIMMSSSDDDSGDDDTLNSFGFAITLIGDDVYFYSKEYENKISGKTEEEVISLFDKVIPAAIPFYYYKGDAEYEKNVNRFAEIASKENIEDYELTEEEIEFMDEHQDLETTFFISENLAMEDAYEKGLISNHKKDYINNFVCFGSDAKTCPKDNLYRIIGVFNGQVKLIKYDYANSDLLGENGDYSTEKFLKSDESHYLGNKEEVNRYYWNYKNDTSINSGRGSNNWETSLLNTINLNTNYINYLNNINPKWVNMIADTKWNIGGCSSDASTAQEFNNEEKTQQTSEPSKIGMMTASEYMFSTNMFGWDHTLYHWLTDFIGNHSASSVNWLHMGLDEWTMTPSSYGSYYVFDLHDNGYVGINEANREHTARPVFYLNSNVKYVRGNGSITSPLRIT